MILQGNITQHAEDRRLRSMMEVRTGLSAHTHALLYKHSSLLEMRVSDDTPTGGLVANARLIPGMRDGGKIQLNTINAYPLPEGRPALYRFAPARPDAVRMTYTLCTPNSTTYIPALVATAVSRFSAGSHSGRLQESVGTAFAPAEDVTTAVCTALVAALISPGAAEATRTQYLYRKGEAPQDGRLEFLSATSMVCDVTFVVLNFVAWIPLKGFYVGVVCGMSIDTGGVRTTPNRTLFTINEPARGDRATISRGLPLHIKSFIGGMRNPEVSRFTSSLETFIGVGLSTTTICRNLSNEVGVATSDGARNMLERVAHTGRYSSFDISTGYISNYAAVDIDIDATGARTNVAISDPYYDGSPPHRPPIVEDAVTTWGFTHAMACKFRTRTSARMYMDTVNQMVTSLAASISDVNVRNVMTYGGIDAYLHLTRGFSYLCKGTLKGAAYMSISRTICWRYDTDRHMLVPGTYAYYTTDAGGWFLGIITGVSPDGTKLTIEHPVDDGRGGFVVRGAAGTFPPVVTDISYAMVAPELDEDMALRDTIRNDELDSFVTSFVRHAFLTSSISTGRAITSMHIESEVAKHLRPPCVATMRGVASSILDISVTLTALLVYIDPPAMTRNRMLMLLGRDDPARTTAEMRPTSLLGVLFSIPCNPAIGGDAAQCVVYPETAPPLCIGPIITELCDLMRKQLGAKLSLGQTCSVVTPEFIIFAWTEEELPHAVASKEPPMIYVTYTTRMLPSMLRLGEPSYLSAEHMSRGKTMPVLADAYVGYWRAFG